MLSTLAFIARAACSIPAIRRTHHPALLLIIALLAGSTGRSIAQDSTAQPPLAQEELVDSLWTVDTVVIQGNNETKDFVILREMTLLPGTPITRWAVVYDQNRIYSLRLFNRVHISALPTTPGKATIVVEVHERWYLFPFPVFGIRDRDWHKVFFGVGVLHANFLGRNEKLYGVGILGYDPSLSLLYRNPFLDQQGSVFLETRASVNRVRNKSLLAQDGTDNYDENHVSAGMTIGKRAGIEHTFSLSAGFEYIEVSQFRPGRTISTSGRDRYPVVSAAYVYDTRDLGEYPADGSSIACSVTKYGLFMHDLDYVRYALDVRKFVPVSSSLVLAGRAYADLAAAGPVPPYNHDYFGYGNRIRGHFKDVIEGDELIGATCELHFPLFGPRYFNVSRLPAEFGLWRFGVVAALFGDAGTAWFRGEPLALNRFVRGYGAGIHFLLPYSFVLRTEYALNESRRGEFIVDLGAAL